MLLVPTTSSVSVWETLPPAVVVRFVPTLVVPKLVSVPLLVVSVVPVEPSTVSTPATAFRLPAAPAVIEAVRLFASASVTLLPDAVTAPTKSLPTLGRLTSPVAVMLPVVPTVIAAVCETSPPAVAVRLVPTLVAPKLVVPAVLVVFSVVPVEPLTVRFVPATSVPEPEAVIAAVRALVSVSEMLEPVAVIVPPKSLVPDVSVMAPVPALAVVVPVTAIVPAV